MIKIEVLERALEWLKKQGYKEIAFVSLAEQASITYSVNHNDYDIKTLTIDGDKIWTTNSKIEYL